MLAIQDSDGARLLANELAKAIEPVAAELRLVDVADFIAYIREEKLANVQDIVNSSVELYFKPGTLAFGWGAQVQVEWTSAPVIAIDMEFRHRSAWLVFKLVLRARETEVVVEHASVGKTTGAPKDKFGLLTEAIADAKQGFRSGPLATQ